MKVISGFVVGLFLLEVLVSCGLETVPSLPAPAISDSTGTLVTSEVLSFVHSSATYADTDFKGYYIYYKIYPFETNASTNIAADNQYLTDYGRTVAILANRGYQRFSINPIAATDENLTSGYEDLMVSVGSSVTVALDFTDFIRKSASDPEVQPQLTVGGARVGYLYRSLALTKPSSDHKYLRFQALRSETFDRLNLPQDFVSTISDAQLSAKEYEITVFVAAYGITASLVELFSPPIPWGTLRVIKVNS